MRYEAYQITSKEAHRLPALRLGRERETLHALLKTGAVTLRAIAVAYYSGDIEAARAALYPPAERESRRCED